GDAEVAVGRHLAGVGDGAVVGAGVAAGDGGGLVGVGHEEFYVAADGFLGFGEGAVHDAFPGGAGDDAGFAFEGLAFDGLAFGEEAFEPGVPAGDEPLAFVGREVGVVFRSGVAEEEEVGLRFHGFDRGVVQPIRRAGGGGTDSVLKENRKRVQYPHADSLMRVNTPFFSARP